MAANKIDLIIVSQNQKITSRCIRMATEYNYVFALFENADDLFENSDSLICEGCILVDASDSDSESDISGKTQVMRQLFNDACIVVCISSKMTSEFALFIKKSGASLILLENEVIYSSKLDFFAAQIIKVSYLAVKAIELPLNCVLPCRLFHLMPLNQRYLQVFPAQTVIDENKLEKIIKVNELYIKRSDILLLEGIVESNKEMTESNYGFKARYYYKALCKVYADLIFLITDQSEYLSFEKAQSLYAECRRISTELLKNLNIIGEPWYVIDYSNEGNLGTVERGPAVAAYAGYMSTITEIGEPLDIMMGALLSDIGLLDIDANVTKKLKDGDLKSLHLEEQAIYKNHPVISINRCLAKKLPLADISRNIISYAHERVDQRGFPHRPGPEKIPMESMLVALCFMLDSKLILRFGKARITASEAKKSLLTEVNADVGLFSKEFNDTVWNAWLLRNSS